MFLILVNIVNIKLEFFKLELITGNNSFTARINNIYYNDINYNLPYINNTDQVLINSNQNDNKLEIKTIQQLNYDSKINSQSYIKKKTCESYKNQALCWQNNNCKWDNDSNNPHCMIARTMLL